jgi:hypothetical protein
MPRSSITTTMMCFGDVLLEEVFCRLNGGSGVTVMGVRGRRMRMSTVVMMLMMLLLLMLMLMLMLLLMMMLMMLLLMMMLLLLMMMMVMLMTHIAQRPALPDQALTPVLVAWCRCEVPKRRGANRSDTAAPLPPRPALCTYRSTPTAAGHKKARVVVNIVVVLR